MQNKCERLANLIVTACGLQFIIQYFTSVETDGIISNFPAMFLISGAE